MGIYRFDGCLCGSIDVGGCGNPVVNDCIIGQFLTAALTLYKVGGTGVYRGLLRMRRRPVWLLLLLLLSVGKLEPGDKNKCEGKEELMLRGPLSLTKRSSQHVEGI